MAAQEAGVSADDRETARKLLDAGDALFNEGKYAEAVPKYQQADAIMRVPTTALPLGKALEAMGKLIEARDSYVSALRYAGPSNSAFDAAKSEADQRAQAIGPRIATLQIGVSGGGATIDLFIDGVKVAGGPGDRSVNPGEHEVKASAAGHRDATATVTLGEGEQKAIALEIEPLPVAPRTPPPKPPPKPVAPPTDASEGGFPVWATVGFSIGAVGIGVGAVTGILSLNKASKLENACPAVEACPDEQGLRDLKSSAITLANVSNIGFIVGGAGVAFGVIALFTLDASGSEDEARLEPLVGPGSLGVRGRF